MNGSMSFYLFSLSVSLCVYSQIHCPRLDPLGIMWRIMMKNKNIKVKSTQQTNYYENSKGNTNYLSMLREIKILHSNLQINSISADFLRNSRKSVLE